jgi:hypothetical protein
MVWLVLCVCLVLSLSHWLMEPLLHGLIAGLSLSWLGGLALVLALWLLAGTAAEDPPTRPKP